MESLVIRKVQARDRLILDVDVWMKNPDDMSFQPRMVLHKNELNIYNGDSEKPCSHATLDELSLSLLERDRMAELRVKFQVKGMHGMLTHKHPILADGNANVKKLAEPRWKSIIPVSMDTFEEE